MIPFFIYNGRHFLYPIIMPFASLTSFSVCDTLNAEDFAESFRTLGSGLVSSAICEVFLYAVFTSTFFEPHSINKVNIRPSLSFMYVCY